MSRSQRRAWFAAILGAALAAGCGSGRPTPKDAEAPSLAGATLHVAAVGPPSAVLGPLSAQRGEWEAVRKAQIAVEPDPIGAGEAADRADVLLFRADRLGDLVDAGAVAPLPPLTPRPKLDGPGEKQPAPVEDPFAFADILEAFRGQVARSGDQLVALPWGGSGLALVYRRDAFERPENLAAAKEAGLELAPPRTYEQLDALARFFHGRDWDGDGQPEAGIAVALGEDPEGVADAAFLARAAALGQHPDHFAFLFDDETMEPMVDRPPFVEALAGLKACKGAGPEDAGRFDAEHARAAFRQGRVALLIDLAEMVPRALDPKEPAPTAVAPLPGSPRVFDPYRMTWQDIDPPNRPSYLPRGGGWLAAISAGAQGRSRDAALDFLRYFAGPETTGRMLGDRDFPVLPTRASHLAAGLPALRNGPGLDVRTWHRTIAETLTAPRVIPGLRIPEADGYLADLSRARIAAIDGGVAPEDALQQAAEAWQQRTRRLGVDRQKWHYRRSLNRPTASPTPPARPAS